MGDGTRGVQRQPIDSKTFAEAYKEVKPTNLNLFQKIGAAVFGTHVLVSQNQAGKLYVPKGDIHRLHPDFKEDMTPDEIEKLVKTFVKNIKSQPKIIRTTHIGKMWEAKSQESVKEAVKQEPSAKAPVFTHVQIGMENRHVFVQLNEISFKVISGEGGSSNKLENKEEAEKGAGLLKGLRDKGVILQDESGKILSTGNQTFLPIREGLTRFCDMLKGISFDDQNKSFSEEAVGLAKKAGFKLEELEKIITSDKPRLSEENKALLKDMYERAAG